MIYEKNKERKATNVCTGQLLMSATLIAQLRLRQRQKLTRDKQKASNSEFEGESKIKGESESKLPKGQEQDCKR